MVAVRVATSDATGCRMMSGCLRHLLPCQSVPGTTAALAVADGLAALVTGR